MPSRIQLLAIVPARGGSKRLPRKNLLPLNGKPLIAWTINAARASNCFVDVLVSTDDREIAEVSSSYGALVPWLRPTEFATDTSRSIDVVLHALDWYERERSPVAGIMLLQPTSPFRTITNIREAAARFIELGADVPVVGVSPASNHPAWTFSVENSRMKPFCGWENLKLRSQDLLTAFTLNGAIYVSTPERLRSTQTFFAEDMNPFLMLDPIENYDIDTEEDWIRAEYLIQSKSQK